MCVSSGHTADLEVPRRRGPREPTSLRFKGELLATQLRLSRNLIGRLSQDKSAGSNIVVSPASLAAIFSQLEIGASTNMRAAIHKSLGFNGPREKSTADLKGLQAAVALVQKPIDHRGPLTLANMIVFDPRSKPFPLALLTLSAAGADVLVKDITKPETIELVNAFVRDRTKGMIPKILEAPPDTPGLVAVNALHFKDKWKAAFDPAQTQLKRFHQLKGKSSDVMLMRIEGAYAFRQNEKFVAVEIPYSADGYNMVVITTRNEPAPVSAFSTVTEWLGGEGFTRSPGEISMPRFSTSESIELLEAIDALGLRAARQRGDAFQSFSPVPQSISRIIQKTELRVNEEGTEAAVATAVTLTRAASVDSDFVKMVVDNAFISIGKSKRPTLIGK